MIFKCALAIWLRSLTVQISYVSSTGEVESRKYWKHRLKHSLSLIHCNTLKFQDESSLRTDQNSGFQHLLF